MRGGEVVDVVEGVLEQAGDGAVVGGRDQDDAVGALQGLQVLADPGIGVLAGRVVVRERQVGAAEQAGGGAVAGALVGTTPPRVRIWSRG
ncbi:hypothetical protein GCM10023259_027470 [Thermocatellispora tengchongensis]